MKSGADQSVFIEGCSYINLDWCLEHYSELSILRYQNFVTKKATMADTPNTSKKQTRYAEKYAQTLNGLFDRFMEMVKEDQRDAMEPTIRAVKAYMSKTWVDMATMEVGIMMLTMDPSCAALHESIDPQPVTSSDPKEDVLTGNQVIR